MRSTRTALCALIVLLALLPLGISRGHLRSNVARIQTIALGGSPGAVALDPELGRAVVADSADAAVSIVALAAARVARTIRVGDPHLRASLALAMDPTTQSVVVAGPSAVGSPGVVQVLDSATGRRLAVVRVGVDPTALALDARRGQLFVANAGDGTVSLLDMRHSALRRTLSVGGTPVGLVYDTRTARAVVVSVGANWGTVSTTDGYVSLLDGRSGHLLRRVEIGDGSAVLALDTRTERLFVANRSTATLSVLDARSGALRRTVTLDAAPSALAVDERRGRVYVVSAAMGTLSLLDAQSGVLLATRRIDPFASAAYALPDALAVDEARDRVYLSTYGPLGRGPQGLALRGNGTLYVLDARTGTVVRRITVGVAPQAVAVDERSGRVVVANGGGEVLRPADGWGEPWISRLRAWVPWLGRGTPPQPTTERVPGSVSLIDGVS